MPVTESDRPHNKQNKVEKRAVEGASPYNNIAEITPRHYKYHFADFSFAAFITFIRENSSLSFSSRESVMNFTMRSFLGMIMFCRAFALRCVFYGYGQSVDTVFHLCEDCCGLFYLFKGKIGSVKLRIGLRKAVCDFQRAFFKGDLWQLNAHDASCAYLDACFNRDTICIRCNKTHGDICKL